MSDEACAECHPDVARRHALSAHAMSSFNNPAYRASIDETRRVVLGRDGHLDAARLCDACHDPVPLYSGRFDEPDYDPDTDPGASAGITCMTCHAMTRSGDVRGNADYRLGNPPAYPFEGSDHPWLAALHRLLMRAKPDLHKANLLNPGHRDPAFCAACHKVQLIEDLNHYRWLPGQNHHDRFLPSGVSGHRVDSFYYPQTAREGCTHCHIPAAPSDDPAAHPDAIGRLVVADHLFPAGNTAIPLLLGRADGNPEREDVLAESARIDLFALRPAATEAAETAGILRPEMPVLDPGQVYDLDLVVRTTGIGHALTQGTADSNESLAGHRTARGRTDHPRKSSWTVVRVRPAWCPARHNDAE